MLTLTLTWGGRSPPWVRGLGDPPLAPPLGGAGGGNPRVGGCEAGKPNVLAIAYSFATNTHYLPLSNGKISEHFFHIDHVYISVSPRFQITF